MLVSMWHRIRLHLRTLWVRVVAISVLSVLAVLMSKLLSPLIPFEFSQLLGAESVDHLLDIMANSMLTVTTFSLTVTVTVHRAVSQQWTPRAHRIHIKDESMQVVLATFVGAFIYALSSIILRSASYFTDQDLVILFLMTILVYVMVVVMILRWIVRLQTMGSLPDTTDRIARETEAALKARMEQPSLGAQIMTGDVVLPEQVIAVRAPRSGYVLRAYPAAIQTHAEECAAFVYLLKPIGAYVSQGELIAQTTHRDMVAPVLDNIDIGETRDIEQDPGFGLRMMAEIGSKALSSGINDTGTAIYMIDRMTSVLFLWTQPADPVETDRRFPNLFIPPLDPGELVQAPFDLIARDGAGCLDVQLILVERLHALSQHPEPGFAEAARELLEATLVRAATAIPQEIDREVLRRHAEQVTRTDLRLSGTAM